MSAPYQNSIKRQSKTVYRLNKFFKLYGKPLLKAIILVAIFAAASIILMPKDSVWLKALVKPKIYPSGVVFSLVWSFMYLILTLSLTLVLKAKPPKKVLIIYSIIAALNILWIVVFFYLKSLALGVVTLAAAVVFSYFLVLNLFKINKLSAYLMFLFFIWMIFAFWLNYSIYFLN